MIIALAPLLSMMQMQNDLGAHMLLGDARQRKLKEKKKGE